MSTSARSEDAPLEAASGRARLVGTATAEEAALDDATWDEPAFTQFYARTARRLWSYVRRVSGDAALADDVLQEAYLRYLRSVRARATEPERVSLLYRTATNLVYDHWRRREREARGLRAVPRSSAAVPATLGPDLSRLFETLPPRDRALLWLAHVEGWSHKEIARALGLAAASVRVLLFRARVVLRRRIARAGLFPAGEGR